jgi:hypothetical protein
MENQDVIQKTPEETWTFLMTSEGLMDLPYSQSVEYLGTLIDLSLDLRRDEGLTRAQTWAENLSAQELTSQQRALLHYFSSNIWANIAHLRKVAIQEKTREDEEAIRREVWGWEQAETERQIFHLRAALMENDFCELPEVRQCQILTNLANLYDTVGRFVEAIEYWRRAVSIIPSFEMALGNMGVGLTHYAYSLYDPGHRNVFLQRALSYLESALTTQLHPSARQSFENKRLEIIAQVPSDMQNQDFDLTGYSLGDSELEVEYRQWCLANGLFLNPLNDIGSYPIAAQDIFTAPSVVYGLSEAPHYHGYFNQLKQEFVSARYFYYEGIKATSVHFSDKDVLLYNTLDYPLYSLASERVKVAFRMAYSLFDKISYLLNAYLTLGIPEKQVKFGTIWYRRQQRKKGLKPEFENRQNWPLRGLFWLSKDLFEDKEGFKDSTEPEARDLAEIRNHLEHKYLKLHSESLSGFGSNSIDTETVSESSSMFRDNLAFSLYHGDFETKTLRLLKVARAALIYLSLSIHCEEYLRQQESDSSRIIVGQELDIWRDEWKL